MGKLPFFFRSYHLIYISIFFVLVNLEYVNVLGIIVVLVMCYC